jgi:hypothetical protein
MDITGNQSICYQKYDVNIAIKISRRINHQRSGTDLGAVLGTAATAHEQSQPTPATTAPRVAVRTRRQLRLCTAATACHHGWRPAQVQDATGGLVNHVSYTKQRHVE